MKIKENTLRRIIRESISENYASLLVEAAGDEIQTVGDLKALINLAIKKKKFKTSSKAAAGGALDLVPGLSTARSAFDALKALAKLPDKARPAGALGNLDVDDDVSKIVDDPIENKFLNVMATKFASTPDNKPLGDVNMTNQLANFMSKEFNSRTVKGFEK